MRNKDIRESAAKDGVKLWQIAEAIGISDSSFSRRLRKELPPEAKAEIFSIINRLAREVS